MQCDELTNDVLIDYNKKKVAETVCREIESHLTVCSKCRERAKEITSVINSLSAYYKGDTTQNIPPRLDFAVLQNIKEVSASIRRIHRFKKLMVITAVAAIFIITFGIVVYIAVNQNETSMTSRETHRKINSTDLAKVPLPKDVEPKTPKVEITPIKPVPPELTKIAIPGDVNGDSKVNIADAMLIYQAIVEGNSKIDISNGDTNQDGKVDIADVTFIIKTITVVKI